MDDDSGQRKRPFRLRRATAADALEAAAVWRSAWWDGHRGRVSDELTRHRGDDYFRHQAAAWTPLTTLAVDAAGAILGLVVVDGDELVQLAVTLAARRLGVGAALLQAAEDEIGRAHQQAWLAVVPGNATARRFYERHGWCDAGPYEHLAPGAPDGSSKGVPVPTHRYVKRVGRDLLEGEEPTRESGC